MQQTLNFNYSQCIKQASHWGYDKFYNVCNGVGDWITVPWGASDWTAAILLCIFIATMIGAMGIIAYAGWRAKQETDKLVERFPF
jgi:hypothetical protein